jgi:2-methylcitrate dehydratase PrpD
MKVTERLAQFVVTTRLADIPAHVIAAAKTAILDTVGVTLAGVSEPIGQMITDFVHNMACGPQATVLGSNLQTSPSLAALANGTFGHALDYDDTNWQMHGHASVAILPAVLAQAEVRNATGCEVLEAYIIGFEVGAKLGAGMNMAHYRQGWHATGTLGAMGATAAVARLRRLPLAQTTHALACAASHASGLRANFGSMTKPLHAGLAAETGVRVAALAAAGITANPHVIEAPLGFCEAFSGSAGYRLHDIVDNLGRPYAFEQPGNNLKPYPCCISAHAPVDALRDLMTEEGLTLAEVKSIDVGLVDVSMHNLFYHRPRTSLEGKFSAEYCVARMLMDGELTLETFTDAAVNDPVVQSVIDKIHVHVAEEIAWPGGVTRPAIVTVQTRHGRSLRRRTDRSRGNPDWPMTPSELQAKFRDCASRRLREEQVEKVLQRLISIEAQEEIRSLMALLQ